MDAHTSCSYNSFGSCNGCPIYNRRNRQISKLDGYTTNYNNGRDIWNPKNETCIRSFIKKFAARRLLFYFHYKLSSLPINCYLAKNISEHLVGKGNFKGNLKSSPLTLDKELLLTKSYIKTPEEITFLEFPPLI